VPEPVIKPEQSFGRLNFFSNRIGIGASRYEGQNEGTATTEDRTMKLGIPGFPFEVVVALIRKPSALRWRLSLRGLLLLVMFATIFTWCVIGVFDRYAFTTITQMYYVGDLLPRSSAQLAAELPRFAELLKSSATHDMWSSRNRSVTPFPLSLSLIVSDSKSGHQRVADWLRKQREEQDHMPPYR
jgi:hypothetical protein